MKHRTFVAQEGRSAAEEFERNNKGQTVAANDMGFMLSPRVTPRELKGIVISMDHYMDNKEPNSLIKENVKQEDLSELLRECTRNIVQLMLQADREKPELLIPIYDQNGNMWWPKEMTHQEIIERKKKEAARDASM